MRVLFDQATPLPIGPYLVGHSVRTAAQQGWATLGNGDLLKVAEEAGFDVLLTTDKNMRYQQNLAGRKIAIVVLGQQQWPRLRLHVQRVIEAVQAAAAGSLPKSNSRRDESAAPRTRRGEGGLWLICGGSILISTQTDHRYPGVDTTFSAYSIFTSGVNKATTPNVAFPQEKTRPSGVDPKLETLK
jgi:hypothetical protein